MINLWIYESMNIFLRNKYIIYKSVFFVFQLFFVFRFGVNHHHKKGKYKIKPTKWFTTFSFEKYALPSKSKKKNEFQKYVNISKNKFTLNKCCCCELLVYAKWIINEYIECFCFLLSCVNKCSSMKSLK